MCAPTDRLADLLLAPCSCTGRCGTLHRGDVCGREPTFTTRNLAAPADPSTRPQTGHALFTWCPACYQLALKSGRERRAEQRRMALERGQGHFF